MTVCASAEQMALRKIRACASGSLAPNDRKSIYHTANQRTTERPETTHTNTNVTAQ